MTIWSCTALFHKNFPSSFQIFCHTSFHENIHFPPHNILAPNVLPWLQILIHFCHGTRATKAKERLAVEVEAMIGGHPEYSFEVEYVELLHHPLNTIRHIHTHLITTEWTHRHSCIVLLNYKLANQVCSNPINSMHSNRWWPLHTST